MQCNAMQCNAMQCNAMQCNAMQCNAMQCNAMQCNAITFNSPPKRKFLWQIFTGASQTNCSLSIMWPLRVHQTLIVYAPPYVCFMFGQRLFKRFTPLKWEGYVCSLSPWSGWPHECSVHSLYVRIRTANDRREMVTQQGF